MGDALALFATRFFCAVLSLCVCLCVCVCVCVCVHLDVWADDWEEAYQTLRQVVRGYLLLEEQEEEGKNYRASPDNTSTGVYLFVCSHHH